VAERLPAVVYIDASDEVGYALYMSPQCEEMLGYSPDEWISDPDLWARLLHPEDRDRTLTERNRSRATEEPFNNEYRLLARGGRVVWVRDESILVKNQLGDTSYWQGVITDITEHKHAEEVVRESELRLRTVVANVAMMVFALDHAGVFTLSEGKGLDALGLEPSEVVGRSVSEVLGNRPEVLNDVDRALAGEEFSAVREINSRTFEVWYSPLKASTGEVSGVIGAAVDISERK
jgi:PAS domain S-box-containing protein